MSKIIRLLCLWLIIYNSVYAQKKSKNWFLLDSIDENRLSVQDKYLLDSILPLIHRSNADSFKTRQLIYLANNLGDEKVWPLYNKLALAFAEKGGDNKKFLVYKSAALSNIGFELTTLKGDHKKALKVFEQNLVLQKELRDTVGMNATLNNIAVIYLNWGHTKKAIELQNEILKNREIIHDKYGEAISYFHLGQIYNKQGDLARAVNYFSRSLNILEYLNEQRDQADVLIELGLISNSQMEYKKSLEYFQKAKMMLKISGEKQTLAKVYNNIGRTLVIQKRFDLAEAHYLNAKKLFEIISDHNGIGTTYLHLGNLYFEKGNSDTALIFLTQAERKLTEVGNLQDLVNVYNSISEIHFERNNFSSAQDYSQKALKIALKFGFPIMIKFPSKKLYQIYKLQNRNAEALKMHELYVSMNDSLNRIENKKAVLRQQFKYEYDKKAVSDSLQQAEFLKYEKKKHEAELGKQKVVIYGFVFCFILTLGIATISYRAYRIKKQSTKEILSQKQIIEIKQKEILASIYYAKRIQTAILPSEKYLARNLNKLKDKETKKMEVDCIIN